MTDYTSRRLYRADFGLTLIELLIAIAALGLLGACFMAAVTANKNESRSRSTLRQTITEASNPRLVLRTPATSTTQVPILFRERPFNSAALANAVNHFVAIGEATAILELNTLASEEFEFTHREFSIHERIGWVCRVLFVPRGREPLRQPLYGALRLPYDSMPLERWPLFPVAFSGTTYFVLSEGYELSGRAEPAEYYIAYCRENGTFRRTPVKVPTREQAMKDAAALRQSEAWKAIQWPGSSPEDNETERELQIGKFIQAQAESIPTQKP
jgi:prepilin-type N-terminal cleavage/methylation domain-containing protein